MNPDSVLVFTDGASKGNPGPGGWAAVISYDGKVTEIGGKEAVTTNNRMELMAAIKALSYLSSLDSHLSSPVSVYSDSSYVVNGITKWVHGWKRNGWRTSAKQAVENQDLWEQLDEASSHFSVEWKRVAGHADTPGNARADEIASAMGAGEPPALFSGERKNYPHDLSVIGIATGGRSRVAYSYVSLVGGKIEIHKTWEECKRRVHGKPGARFKKSASEADERTIIGSFGKK